jgi:hypothetical protein
MPDHRPILPYSPLPLRERGREACAIASALLGIVSGPISAATAFLCFRFLPPSMIPLPWLAMPLSLTPEITAAILATIALAGRKGLPPLEYNEIAWDGIVLSLVWSTWGAMPLLIFFCPFGPP